MLSFFYFNDLGRYFRSTCRRKFHESDLRECACYGTSVFLRFILKKKRSSHPLLSVCLWSLMGISKIGVSCIFIYFEWIWYLLLILMFGSSQLDSTMMRCIFDSSFEFLRLVEHVSASGPFHSHLQLNDKLSH